MTIQEKRWMDMDNLRALCIRHGWFTRGDCKAYDKFLNMPYDAKGTQRNITTKLLYSMARTIMQYAGKEELLMNIKKSLYSQPQSVTASKPDGYMSSYGDK